MVEPMGARHWPTEIRLKQAERLLEIDFDNGVTFRYPAEFLRVESPSAEVQGHGPGQKQLITGRAAIGIIGIEPVGNYAVRIKFDDLHDTGIYSWSYLYELGERKDALWETYLRALATAGLSREPARR
ncbi:MAG: gamma-butyrobetaine hydroxylase-like domain-containing protein [Dongiaceae bacterium]